MGKSNLAIFDFDYTLRTPGTGIGLRKLFPNHELPVEVSKLKEDKDWDNFYIALTSAVNELNVPKEDVLEAMTESSEIVHGMDGLIKSLAKNHDIIIISGSFQDSVRVFLQKYGLTGKCLFWSKCT